MNQENKENVVYRKCVVSSQQLKDPTTGKAGRKDTQCGKCDVGLCVDKCFETYHTKKVFSQCKQSCVYRV